VATIDRMRIVEMRNYVPYPILDLMDGVNYTHIKGQFTVSRPAKTRTSATSSRRHDGERVTSEKLSLAAITAQWFIASGGSQDNAMALLERMGQVLEDATAQGRLIEVRMAGTTRSVFYEPRGTGDWNLLNYDPQQFVTNGVLQATATIPVAPLCSGLPMDILDTFQTDTLANGDWLKDGAAALQTLGTSLAPNGLGTYRYRRAIGYPYQDVEMRMQFTVGTTITGGRWGMYWSADTAGADTKMGLELDQTAGQVQLVTYVAGARTVIQNFLLTVVAGILYEMRIIRQGDTIKVFCNNMNQTAGTPQTFQLSDFTTTSYTHTYTLTGSQLRFQQGDVGIAGVSVDALERIESFVVRPFSYYNVPTPEEVVLNGKIPGSAPAAVDLEVTTNDTGAIGQAPVWGLWSWSERPLVCNLCHSGDFEASTGTTGWNRLVLTNYITNAATSIAQDGSASRYGAGEMTVVTPASTQSGASFTINRRMKANRQYAAWCWVKSAAGTTSIAAKIGSVGAAGVTIGTAKNLSTAWQLISALYRPTVDSDGMTFAVTTQAATATTFNVDGVVVVEVPTITLAAALTSNGTSMSVYQTAPDAPYLRPDGTLAQPFLFLIDQELIRCTAISGTTWTIERGAEYTALQTHSQDSVVVIAPPLQPHLEGKGAEPCFGVIEGENYAADISGISGGAGTLGIVVDSAARGQQRLDLVGTPGSVIANEFFYIEPNAIAPDDFTLGEVDVEVFARIATPSGFTFSILASVEPTEKIGTGLVLAGRRRNTREFGSVSRATVVPSSGTRYRLTKIGTFPMLVDRQNPQRWRLKLVVATSGAATISTEYLLIHPVRYRACPPTGKVDDGGVTYPNFIPPDSNWGSTNYAMTKIFRTDGSALIRNPIPDTGRMFTLPPAFPDHGLGKQITFPPGNVNLNFKLTDTIPDDPTVNAVADMSGGASPSWQCTLRAIVTPRYYVGRGGY
jgi:hypothetical protein